MGEKIPEFYGETPLDTSLNDNYGDNGELLEEKLPEEHSNPENDLPPSGDDQNAPEAPKTTEEAPLTSIPTDTEGNPVLPPDVAPLEVVIGGKTEVSGDISQEGGAEVKTSYTREDFKKLLSDADIKYFGGSTDEQLAELCIKNNLI